MTNLKRTIHQLPNLFNKVKNIISQDLELLEDEFNYLALELYKHHKKNNLVYKQFWSNYPAPSNYKEIIPVTTELCKRRNICVSPQNSKKIFLSSGTTKENKSTHYLTKRELELYEFSLWSSFHNAFKQVFDFERDFNLFILSKSLEEAPESSLIYMFDYIKNKFNYPNNTFYIKQDKLETNRLYENLQKSIKQNKPALILGTAFSFVHYLDANLPDIQLPENSAIMETGGFKGQSREVSKEWLYEKLSKNLGIPEKNIIGQYGMSELCSQYYQRPCYPFSGMVGYRIPKWCRIRIVHPADPTIDIKNGESGLIYHYDLANIDSMPFLLSGDLGIKHNEEHFELIGRAPNISLKGCSLNYEEITR